MIEAKNTLIYTLLGILPSILNFILLPIYMSRIEPAEYGSLSLINIFTSIVALLGSMKLDAGLRVVYFDYDDEKDKVSLSNSILTFQLINILLIFGVISIFGEAIFKYIFEGSINYFPVGCMILLAGLLSGVNTILIVLLQNQQRVRDIVKITLVASLSMFLLNILNVVIFDLKILGIAISNLIVTLCYVLFTLYKLNFKPEFNWIKLQNILKVSLTFIPFIVILTIEQSIDRIFLARYFNLELVGKFSALLAMCSFIPLIYNSFDNAIRPNLYTRLKEEDLKNETLLSYLKTYGLVSILSISILALGISVLFEIFEFKKYTGLKNLILPYLLSILPLYFIRFFALVFAFKKEGLKLSIITGGKLVVMIMLMLFLIPTLGMNGIFISLFISNVLNGIIFYILTRETIIQSKLIFLTLIPNLLLLIIGLLIIQLVPSTNFQSILFVGIASIITVLFYKKEVNSFISLASEKLNRKSLAIC